MTDAVLARLAQARAIMLASSAFPPAAHLAYLEQAGPAIGTGFSPIAIGALTLREVDPMAERVEVIRVVSETLLTFGQVGRMLATPNAVPGALLAANLVWFGIERDGVLIGLHGGFFWSSRLWIRRFYATLDDLAWEVHVAIESAIHGHLWDAGMREGMMQLPAGTPNLAARLASGWSPVHEVVFQQNARPFVWLRYEFPDPPARPGRPPLTAGAAWQVTGDGFVTRELDAGDAPVIVALMNAARSGCRIDPDRAGAMLRRWVSEGSTIVGTFDAAGLYALRVVDRSASAAVARLRAACCRDPLEGPDGYSDAMKRSLRGYVAWLRQVGAERVTIVLQSTTLVDWDAVRRHLDEGTVAAGRFECDVAALAAFAGAP
jgi:hypothetical protein